MDLEQFYYICASVLFGVFGLCIGSFLNVIIYRVPLGMNISKPASHCPKCNHLLSWKDNIPLLSFIILGGKCRYCREPISPRYFVVELANCLLWLLGFFVFYNISLFYAIVAVLATSVLLCIALCDWDNMFIPDSLQIALAVVAVASIFCDPYCQWLDHVIGLVVGGGFFLLFYYGSFWVLHKEGLGFGDVKLMACMGFLLGWKKIIFVILLGTLLALGFIVARKLFVKPVEEDTATPDTLPDQQAEDYDEDEESEEGHFPFAPALAMAGFVALYFGEWIIDKYTSLFM